LLSEGIGAGPVEGVVEGGAVGGMSGFLGL
jgi:hypothetical protein